MDTNGHFSIQGEALERFSVQIKMLLYPPTLSTWWLDLEGARGINTTTIYVKKSTSLPVSGRCFFQIYKDQNDRIGNIYRLKNVVGPILMEHRL